MTPLDLRTRPPRGPREQLDGLMMLPRTIDKIRASLPGGNLGPYRLTPGLSQALLSMLHVDIAALVAEVARAENDAQIADWMRTRVPVSQYEAANTVLANLTDEDVPHEHRALFESLYPEYLRRRHRRNFDLLEADDRELYPDFFRDRDEAAS